MSETDRKAKEDWTLQKISPVGLLKQDAECLLMFLKQEGQETGLWEKRLEEWEKNLTEEADEEQEESVLEQGMDLTSDQLMALSACYEQQGVLPAQDREYLMVVNTAPFEREDMMESEGHLLVSADGKQLPVQWTEETTLWKPECIPQYGFRIFETVQAEMEEESTGTIKLDSESMILETPYYEVRFNEAMEMVSFVDKEGGQELLQAGKAGNVLYADGKRCAELAGTAVSEQGAIRTVLQIVKQVQDSYVVEELVFYEHSKRVDIRLLCLNQGQEQLPEIRFSFASGEKKTAVIRETGYCLKEETEQCLAAEQEETVFYLFPYKEEDKEDVYKEACLVWNSVYQIAGQLPFRKKEHSYVHVPEETGIPGGCIQKKGE